MNNRFECYIINLNKAVDRYDHMVKECDKYQLKANRFEALTPEKIPDWIKRLFYDKDGSIYADLKPGEIGCYASHLYLMDMCIKEDKLFLIMEDDLVLGEGFGFVNEIISDLPHDWDFVRMSNETKSAFKKINQYDFGSLGEHWKIPNNMGAYLVTPKGAKKFINYSNKRFRAIDEDMRRVWEHKAVNYSFSPGLAITNVFDSTIDAFGDRNNETERSRKVYLKKKERYFGRLMWWLQRWGVIVIIKALVTNIKVSILKKIKGKNVVSPKSYHV